MKKWGTERDVIIILYRSKAKAKTKFLQVPNRLNVAVSTISSDFLTTYTFKSTGLCRRRYKERERKV